jgi:hypothetical protein
MGLADDSEGKLARIRYWRLGLIEAGVGWRIGEVGILV